MTNWVRERVLGRGSFGVVFLAKPTKKDSDYVAVKVAPMANCSSLVKEKEVLEHFVGCPSIIQYIGNEISTEGDFATYNLILEYAPGGSLADLIKEWNKLLEVEAKEYLKMILKGLSCIHSRGFVHADLKPGNILVFPQEDGTLKLKIADFGLSKRCEEVEEEEEEEYWNLEPRFRGTPKYMSPESVAFGDVNTPLDIWSVGCILINMISGKPVWDNYKIHSELISKLVYEKKIPEIPRQLSKQGKDFLRKCFERDPRRRWTADMLLEHPYLSEEEKATKRKKSDPDVTTQFWCLPPLFNLGDLLGFL